jgi:hypothetical protein
VEKLAKPRRQPALNAAEDFPAETPAGGRRQRRKLEVAAPKLMASERMPRPCVPTTMLPRERSARQWTAAFVATLPRWMARKRQAARATQSGLFTTCDVRVARQRSHFGRSDYEGAPADISRVAQRPCSATHNSKRSAAVVRPLEHEVRRLVSALVDGH